MLTIFTTPKPFRGAIKQIQINAIKSWTLLRPKCQVLLIGEEEGAREAAEQLGVRLIPEVERNERGTPFVNSMFEKALRVGTQPYLCFINADTVLMDDFVEAVKRLSDMIPRQDFLLVGGKWDIEQFDPETFEHTQWQTEMKQYLRQNCRRYDAFEYFVYPRGLPWDMPPILMRPCIDNWLIYKARALKIPVVDGTPAIDTIHQRHDHLHYLKKEQLPLESDEVRYNLKILGFWHKYTLLHRTHVLTPDGLDEQRNNIRAFIEQLRILEIYLNYLLRSKFYPYSYPLYVVLKEIKRCLGWICRMLVRRQTMRISSTKVDIEKAIRVYQEIFPFENYTDSGLGAHKNIARTVLRYLRRGCRILDFGCGACDKTAILALLGFECSACDDLKDMWHQRDDNKERIISFTKKVGIDFRLLDSEPIPFEKHGFDMVMMHDVLEHIRGSPRKLLNSLLKLVKPEGLIFFTVPNAVSLRKRINALRGRHPTGIPYAHFYFYPGGGRGHVHEYTKNELRELAGYLNLKILELHGCDHRLWRLPVFARFPYQVLTHLFNEWCDTLLMVAQKKSDWIPEEMPSEEELDKIFDTCYY